MQPKVSKHFELDIPIVTKTKEKGRTTVQHQFDITINGIGHLRQDGIVSFLDYEIEEVWWITECGKMVDAFSLLKGVHGGDIKECGEIHNACMAHMYYLFGGEILSVNDLTPNNNG